MYDEYQKGLLAREEQEKLLKKLSENTAIKAIEIKTKYSPKELLNVCQEIEKKLGREHKTKNDYEDRTIDIDILFYNNDVIKEEDLEIPHKYVHLRAFTLVPMMELNADYVHPILHKTIVEMHSDLENPEMVFLYGTRVDIDF